MHLVGDPRARASDADRGCLEVDIDPAEPEQLRPSHPCERRQAEQRVESVVSDMVEEPSQLVGRPHSHLLGLALRAVDVIGGVMRDQPLTNRPGERGPEHAERLLQARLAKPFVPP